MFEVRDGKIEKLRSNGYEGTSEEWSSILQFVFSPLAPVKLSDSLRDTLNIACTASGNSDRPSLHITVRQSVEGITHKFGAIELKFTENIDGVDLFGWANEAVETRDSLARDLRESNSRYEKAGETIRSLQQQLENLIAAKKEHETQLLSNFAILLNEKKLRIRSQQRQIVQQDSSSQVNIMASSKQSQKRKSRDKHDVVDAAADDGHESEGFDNMALDQDGAVDDADSEDPRMTSSDSDTESESEMSSRPVPASAKAAPADAEILPPPRQLPFGGSVKSPEGLPGTVTASKPDSDDEETASEEEL